MQGGVMWGSGVLRNNIYGHPEPISEGNTEYLYG